MPNCLETNLGKQLSGCPGWVDSSSPGRQNRIFLRPWRQVVQADYILYHSLLLVLGSIDALDLHELARRFHGGERIRTRCVLKINASPLFIYNTLAESLMRSVSQTHYDKFWSPRPKYELSSFPRTLTFLAPMLAYLTPWLRTLRHHEPMSSKYKTDSVQRHILAPTRSCSEDWRCNRPHCCVPCWHPCDGTAYRWPRTAHIVFRKRRQCIVYDPDSIRVGPKLQSCRDQALRSVLASLVGLRIRLVQNVALCSE
jgi:hypothetical protein